MYPYDDQHWFTPHGEPHDAYDVDELDRLTHLVLVDGRLVATWSEPVTGTRWQRYADRFDRELARPVETPPRPPYQQVLDWLAEVCGGAAAVRALTAEPLVDDGIDLPTETPDQQSRSRLEATAELLDAVAARWFDAEVSFAFRQALLCLWSAEPESVRGARTAAHLAGGICWAVGKANGLFRPQGELTMARVQEALALSSPLSAYGSVVQRALRGFLPAASFPLGRPGGVPDLMALGQVRVLTSPTRERLVRLRDRALAAEAAATDAA